MYAGGFVSTNITMRMPFTDGLNSLVHVLLGVIGWPPVALLFVAYQIADGGDNMPVDILEFVVGLLVGRTLCS